MGFSQVKQVTIIDTVYDKLPDEVYEDIRDYWSEYTLGNDTQYVYAESFTIDYIDEETNEWKEGPRPTKKWVEDHLGLNPSDVMIHHWW